MWTTNDLLAFNMETQPRRLITDVGALVIKQLVLLPAFLVSVFTCYAYSAVPDFYTINDTNGVSTHNAAAMNPLPPDIDPFNTFQSVANELSLQTARFVSLLNWDHHQTSMDEPSEPYNRLRHFGGWLVEDFDRGGCIDTRAKVLARQSARQVTYNETGCRVVTGQWKDHYTGLTVTEARVLDIDHVVPLKNSYVSGGWKWDREKRCAYANFMANGYHLLAVNSSDNRKKGQDGPDKFMPEAQSFACEYLNVWLKIKLIWGLALPSEEAGAIARLMKQHGCNVAKMSMSVDDLRSQRRSIVNQSAVCAAAF